MACRSSRKWENSQDRSSRRASKGDSEHQQISFSTWRCDICSCNKKSTYSVQVVKHKILLFVVKPSWLIFNQKQNKKKNSWNLEFWYLNSYSIFRRNSKLTHLLQDSLGTYFFPPSSSSEETFWSHKRCWFQRYSRRRFEDAHVCADQPQWEWCKWDSLLSEFCQQSEGNRAGSRQEAIWHQWDFQIQTDGIVTQFPF